MANEVTGDSEYAVALKLMERIAQWENASDPKPANKEPRQYFLSLYRECLAATEKYPQTAKSGSASYG